MFHASFFWGGSNFPLFWKLPWGVTGKLETKQLSTVVDGALRDGIVNHLAHRIFESKPSQLEQTLAFQLPIYLEPGGLVT